MVLKTYRGLTMSLEITVGLLYLLSNIGEYEGLNYYKDMFNDINKVLKRHNIDTYKEPINLKREEIFYFQIKYSVVASLKKLAAYIALNEVLPSPNYQNKNIIEQYMKEKKHKHSFDHLILHSDCDGFYVPVQFNEIVLLEPSLNIEGTIIGSSYKLIKECELIANFLGLPLDLDLESEEIDEIFESENLGPERWKEYIVESFACLVLYNAARRSICLGASVVFH